MHNRYPNVNKEEWLTFYLLYHVRNLAWIETTVWLYLLYICHTVIHRKLQNVVYMNKKSMFKKKREGNIGSCPHVLVYFTIWVDQKSGLIRRVASLERNKTVVFYYLSGSEICPYKRGRFSWKEQNSCILLSQ